MESNNIVIETKRLFLRKMTLEDYDSLAKVISDPINMKYYKTPYDHDGVLRWINWNLDNYQKYNFGLWAVCLKDSGEMIGDCGITMQPIDGGWLPEIGYHLRLDMHGKGYAKEAGIAVRDWSFKNTSFTALYSYCTSDNVASLKTAEAIGMKFLKEYTDKDEVLHVSVIYKRLDN